MIRKSKYKTYAANPSAFRNDLIIEVGGSAKKFGDVIDDWQRADFESLDPGLLKCVGRSDSDAKLRAYFERARGHSKTTDIAVTCVWLLTFATRPIKGYTYAADRDQASLLRDAMLSLVRMNPWLSDILSVDREKVHNIAKKHPGNGSVLKIETSDVASSYGILPDFIVADEFTHWQGDGGLWNSLISSAAKKSTCLLLGISNAGFVDSWRWNIRELIRSDDAWIFSRLNGPQASWMTAETLDEQKRMLPTVAFNRLWMNEWSSGGGDALREEDINAAFVEDLKPMEGTRSEKQNWKFVAGVDLGLKRDFSAVVVVAVGKPGTAYSGTIRLAAHRVWKPTNDTKINLQEVENFIRTLDNVYGLSAVAFDPWQAEHLAQRLERDRKARHEQRRANSEPWMRSVPPSGTNLRDITSLTIESFTDRRLQLYECEPLRRDLSKLRVEEKSYGYRLTSPRDEHGHGDTFSAFSLALFIGHKTAGRKPAVAGPLFSGNAYGFDSYQRRNLIQHERELANMPDDDNEQFRNLMKLFGRTK